MTKTDIIDWAIANTKIILQSFLFVATGILGTLVKVLKYHNSGNKLTFTYLITEIFMSVLVGLTVYGIFDQFLNCHQLFTCVVCAWCSSFSTIFNDRVKELLELSFVFIKKIFTTQTPTI